MTLVKATLVGGQEIKAHGPEDCKSPPCCIHSPSDHHMKEWKQNWRSDRGIMERICPHGIGHPDPDDTAVREGRDEGIHGCDGCCRGGAVVAVPIVTDVDRAFPVSRSLGDLPESIPDDYPLKAKWLKFCVCLFFTGAKIDPSTIGMLPRKGVTASDAWRALEVLMGVRDMKHERKMDLWPYLASEWFEDVRWEFEGDPVRFEDEEFDREWVQKQESS